MCNCSPKITFIGKINNDGYAFQKCKSCGEEKLIPVTERAIAEHYDIKYVYLVPKEAVELKYY